MGSGLVGLHMTGVFIGKMLTLGNCWPWEGHSFPGSVKSSKWQNLRRYKLKKHD